MSIDAGLAHAGVAIDRQEGSVSIGQDGDLMAVNARSVLGDGRDLSCGGRIDKAHITVSLIHDEKRLSVGAREEQRKTKTSQE